MSFEGNEAEPDTALLRWARVLQAHAQNGLYYAKDPFDKERYSAVQKIATEMLSQVAEVDIAVVERILDEQAGYATPKVDVRCALFREGQILLVRERREGLWTLPGGWADVDDSPSEAAERELWEESGYVGRATKVLAVWDRRLHQHPPHAFAIYKIIFRCELVADSNDQHKQPDDSGGLENLEIDEVGFFAEDALPPLSVGRTTEQQIHRLFRHYYDPDLPTDFD